MEAGAEITVMCVGHGKPLELAEQTGVGRLWRCPEAGGGWSRWLMVRYVDLGNGHHQRGGSRAVTQWDLCVALLSGRYVRYECGGTKAEAEAAA